MVGRVKPDVPAWLPLARAMSEKTLQENVRRCAVLHGWLFFHAHDSRHSPAGFPDVIAIRDGVLLVAELKRERGLPTGDQRRWLAAFGAAGARVFLWTPGDWLRGEIAAILRGDPC